MTVEGTDKVLNAFKKIPRSVLKQAQSIIDINARVLQRYIRTEKLTGGTTPTQLRVRSGRLRASVIPMKTEIKEDRAEGGISFGTVYSRVHVGPKGQTTLIAPKKVKFLTIPLPAAMTKAGVVKGPARSAQWGDTFVRKSKAGNLIIFGKKRIMKGKKEGELRGEVIPLFLLVKNVKVKARVHPEDLILWIEPKIKKSFSDKRIEVQ
jgi:hypothetical protein